MFALLFVSPYLLVLIYIAVYSSFHAQITRCVPNPFAFARRTSFKVPP